MSAAPFLVYVPSALPRRYCTADSPMDMADKNNYQWGHPDAVEAEPFHNLVIYVCPHCRLAFHGPKRAPSDPHTK
jgi:hypothetical protein